MTMPSEEELARERGVFGDGDDTDSDDDSPLPRPVPPSTTAAGIPQNGSGGVVPALEARPLQVVSGEMVKIQQIPILFDDSGDVDDTESDDSPLHRPAPPSSAAASSRDPSPNPAAGIPQNGSGGVVPALETRPLQVVSSGEMVKIHHIPILFDDSRRLFQRLFTDADEITILQGFLEFVSQRGTTHASYQYDTGPFYDQIKARLQLDFTKSQLAEKLRRLKKKYRTAAARISSGRSFAFKSPHDKATYEISQHVWSPTFKRPRDEQKPQRQSLDSVSAAVDFDQKRARRRVTESSGSVEVSIEGLPSPMASNDMIEEAVKSCLSPLFKELISYAMMGPGMGGIGGSKSAAASMGLSPMPLLSLGHGDVAAMDEKWRKQSILEVEAYAKRMELVKEQIETRLSELRSMGG